MTINMLITLKQALIELFFSRTHFASEALVRRRQRRRRRVVVVTAPPQPPMVAVVGTHIRIVPIPAAPPTTMPTYQVAGRQLKTAVRLHYIPALAFVFPLLPFFVASSYITVWRIIDD